MTIEAKAKEYFISEVSQGRIFTSMPDKYSISIDKDDCVFVSAEWSDGVRDYAGIGNIYKILCTDLNAENEKLREVLREIVKYTDEMQIAKTDYDYNISSAERKATIIKAKQLITE